MKVRVLFFSVLREQVGCSEMDVVMQDPATAKDLLDLLEAKYPVLASYRNSTRVAVNYEYVSADKVLAERDEVALIPPVSGG
jgi:molybdopterin synthase sulfur carrier subunit